MPPPPSGGQGKVRVRAQRSRACLARQVWLGSVRTVGLVTVINNLTGSEDGQREGTSALPVSEEEVSSTVFVR